MNRKVADVKTQLPSFYAPPYPIQTVIYTCFWGDFFYCTLSYSKIFAHPFVQNKDQRFLENRKFIGFLPTPLSKTMVQVF